MTLKAINILRDSIAENADKQAAIDELIELQDELREFKYASAVANSTIQELVNERDQLKLWKESVLAEAGPEPFRAAGIVKEVESVTLHPQWTTRAIAKDALTLLEARKQRAEHLAAKLVAARSLLELASDYISDIPESAVGGDDEAVQLGRDIRIFLATCSTLSTDEKASVSTSEKQCKWVRDDYHWKTQCGLVTNGIVNDPETTLGTCPCGANIVDLEKAYAPAMAVAKSSDSDQTGGEAT